MELGNETNDIDSVESKGGNLRFHENVAATKECKLGILAFELEKLISGYFRFHVRANFTNFDRKTFSK